MIKTKQMPQKPDENGSGRLHFHARAYYVGHMGRQAIYLVYSID